MSPWSFKLSDLKDSLCQTHPHQQQLFFSLFFSLLNEKYKVLAQEQSSSAAPSFHCCRLFVVCPMPWDKEFTWKSISALSLLGLERSSVPAVKNSHFSGVRDMERASVSVCQHWVWIFVLSEKTGEIWGAVVLNVMNPLESPSAPQRAGVTQEAGAGQHTVLPWRASFNLLRAQARPVPSNFSDLVYFSGSDPVSLSLISKARAGLRGSLNGPLVLIKILV